MGTAGTMACTGRCRAMRGAALVLAAVLVAFSQGTAAQQAQPGIEQAQAVRAFNIPPQSLTNALTLFGEQSGWQVSVRDELIRGVSTPGISGTMTPEQALQRLLAGTRLSYTISGGNTVTLQKLDASGLPPGVMQLDPVQVQGYPVPPQAMIDNIPPPYAGGQVATGGQLGLLGNRSVMDTPFNQTNYTARTAQDQQAQTIRDVFINDPSVRAASSNGSVSGDVAYIRGFSVGSNTYSYGGLFGILPFLSTSVELAERIELLKGPSAMLNGMPPGNAIGGVINVVPKRAPNEPLTQFTASYNSAAQFGGHADIARRFGADKQFGARFNGVFQAGQTSVQNNTDQRGLAVLGLDFRGESVRLSADLGYQNQYVGGLIPLALLANGVPVPWAPNALTNFGQPWNMMERKDLFGVIRAELDMTENITAYASFGVHDYRMSTLTGGNIITVTNFNGDVVGTSLRQSQYQTVMTGQVGFRGFVETGPISHEFAVTAMTLEQADGFGATNGTAIATNIFSPTYVAQPNIAIPIANKTSTGGQSSIGFADTMSAADKRIQLTVGGRWQQVKSTQFNGVSGAVTSLYDESTFSPAVALVFKPWEDVSVYGNWIQGLQQGRIVGAGFANAGEIFPPFKSTQYEAGVKVDWGKFTTTASVFQISQPSVLTNASNNTQFLGGEQVNQGLELNVFGEPMPGVRLLGGIMLLNAVLTKTQGDLTNGWIAPFSPQFNLNLAGEWDLPFARGLTLDGRIVYTSSQYIDTLYPRRSFPSWTRFDIGARYTLDNVTSPTGKPVAVRFNVDNVLDTNYWMVTGYLGAPRTFRLSLTADF